ncbi:MAG: MFS transporter, partial [Actinomycetota bacterium]|nr:MFS transporter [Actinomycetota bacterium]
VFPAAERPGAIAAWSAVAGVGIVIGPVAGGFLLAHFAWGSVFWINIPLVAIAIIAALAVVPGGGAQRLARNHRRLDLVGAVVSIAGLVSLVDAVIEAPNRGWLSALTIGEVAMAVAFLVGFVRWELHTAQPMIDVRVFTHRAFSVAAGSVSLIFFALMGSLFALTQYLQLVHGYSTLGAGLRALPFAAAMLVVSPLSSSLAGRFGLRVVLPAGLVAMAAGLVGLGQAGPHTAYPALAVAVTVMGSGMALVMAPASESIMTVLPADQLGVGSAVNDTVREVGGALGVAVIGSLVSGAYRSHLHLVAGVPAGLARAARSSIAAGDAVGSHLGGAGGGRIVTSAGQAYATAMGIGFDVAAGVALIGAALVIVSLARPGAAVDGAAG